MALTGEGQVYTWGLARNGTLGVGDFLSLPTDPAYTHDHYQDVPEVMMNLPHGIEERFSIAIGASHSICAYADIGGDQVQEALETFARYVDCDELADVRFLIGEGSDVTQVMAHSQLLSMRCEYFRNMFSSDMRERTRDGPHKYEVAVPDTTVACFKCVLYWAYTGSTAFNSENICGAMRLADKYGLDGLRRLCSQWVGSHLTVEDSARYWLCSKECGMASTQAACLRFTLENFQACQRMESFKDALASNQDLMVLVISSLSSPVEQRKQRRSRQSRDEGGQVTRTSV